MEALNLPRRDSQQLQALRITMMEKITGSRAELNSLPDWLPHGKTAGMRKSKISQAKVTLTFGIPDIFF